MNAGDGAIQVQISFSATAAFAAGLNFELHRPGNALGQPKGAVQPVESSASRTIDPHVELHRDGLSHPRAIITPYTLIG